MRHLDSPTPPLTLRPLNSSDAPALQAVYGAGADFFVSNGGATPPADQAVDDLAAAAADDGRYLLGIDLAGEMVGVIDLRLASPEPFDVHVGLILLTPAYRRQGLGRWALRILEAWLRRATPTEKVVLTVPAHAYAAQAFFRACGYRFSGQSTRIIASGERLRLLTMEKTLRPDHEAPSPP